MGGQRAQLLADHLGHAPADAGVHLVEHEGAPPPLAARRDRADGELKPRELAARGDLLERLLGLARVGREEERCRLRARGTWRLLVHRDERDPEPGLLHREALQLLFDRRAEPRRRRAPLCRKRRRRLPVPGPRRRVLLAPAIERILDVREVSVLGLQCGELLQDLGNRASVLALQAGDLLEPGLERREPVGIRLDGLGRVARRGGEIRDAALQVFGLVAVDRFARIDRRELRECPGRLAQPIRRRALVLGKRRERRLARSTDPVRVEQALALDRKLRVLPLERARPPRSRAPGTPASRDGRRVPGARPRARRADRGLPSTARPPGPWRRARRPSSRRRRATRGRRPRPRAPAPSSGRGSRPAARRSGRACAPPRARHRRRRAPCRPGKALGAAGPSRPPPGPRARAPPAPPRPRRTPPKPSGAPHPGARARPSPGRPRAAQGRPRGSTFRPRSRRSRPSARRQARSRGPRRSQDSGPSGDAARGEVYAEGFGLRASRSSSRSALRARHRRSSRPRRAWRPRPWSRRSRRWRP